MLPDRPAPDFTLKSFFNGGATEDFTLSSVKGNWILLLFYPVDFGYVTPTEFYEINKLMSKFKEANCSIIAISTETIDSQRSWWSSPRTEAGLESMDNLRFVSDRQGQVAASYGVYKANENVAFRATFLLDPDMNVVSIEKCDIPVGLNIGEQLRQVQAALEMEKNPGAGIPADWHPGDEINPDPFIPEPNRVIGDQSEDLKHTFDHTMDQSQASNYSTRSMNKSKSMSGSTGQSQASTYYNKSLKRTISS